MMERMSMGACGFMVDFLADGLYRVICVSTYVFSYTFKYYSAIYRYFSCFEDS
jgi:hypothetical protein